MASPLSLLSFVSDLSVPTPTDPTASESHENPSRGAGDVLPTSTTWQQHGTLVVTDGPYTTTAIALPLAMLGQLEKNDLSAVWYS